ncbi:hypothetical protein PMI40_04766, partial [Herbaspirillum sp. YR522]
MQHVVKNSQQRTPAAASRLG